MKKGLSKYQRISITVLFTVMMIATLLWEHYNGGISTHYLLHDDNMPGISNLWGLIIVPIFTWVVSGLVRIQQDGKDKNKHLPVLLRGVYLFLTGALISIFFYQNPESALPLYLTIALLALAFFLPVYKAECLLGYVAGTLFMFGAFIPVIAGTILWLLFFTAYKGTRKITGFFIKNRQQHRIENSK